MRKKIPLETAPEEPVQPERISRSEKKRRAENAQHLGKTLLDVPPSALNAFGLDDDLKKVLLDLRTLKGEARRRSMQLMGALMRSADKAHIEKTLVQWREGRLPAHVPFDQAQQWRDALVEGDAQVVNEVLARLPGLDRTRLMQLVRAATAEREEGSPPRKSRELYRLLRQELASTPDPRQD